MVSLYALSLEQLSSVGIHVLARLAFIFLHHERLRVYVVRRSLFSLGNLAHGDFFLLSFSEAAQHRRSATAQPRSASIAATRPWIRCAVPPLERRPAP